MKTTSEAAYIEIEIISANKFGKIRDPLRTISIAPIAKTLQKKANVKIIENPIIEYAFC